MELNLRIASSIAVIVLSALVISSFGPSAKIHTDRPVYEQGETVTISVIATGKPYGFSEVILFRFENSKWKELNIGKVGVKSYSSQQECRNGQVVYTGIIIDQLVSQLTSNAELFKWDQKYVAKTEEKTCGDRSYEVTYFREQVPTGTYKFRYRYFTNMFYEGPKFSEAEFEIK